jgi:NAD+ synthase (glutamine-hydrolysing)
MRVALAQINSHLGHFEFNRKKIVEFIHRAADRRADIVVFPEAALFGYHPMDMLERPSLVDEQLRELAIIQKNIPAGVLVFVGAFTKNPSKKGKAFFNSAVALQKGKKPVCFNKQLLPTYGVFDDARHIEPGNMSQNFIKFKGRKLFVTVCEDIWAWPKKGSGQESAYLENPIKKIKSGSADLIINLSASPYYTDKFAERLRVTRATVSHVKAPIVYVNMIGAQDELIFDGGSFALNKKGEVLAKCLHFSEDLNVVDFDLSAKEQRPAQRPDIAEPTDALRQALVLGIRDFRNKTGLEKVHLGLSGGIDSAVVACLAVDAVGPQNVLVYALPGPHSTDLSLQLAKSLADNLHIKLTTMAFTNIYDDFSKLLDRSLGASTFGLMHENLQARIRGVLLMAASNKDRSLLLNTSNKTEIAVGYGTMYGDLCGGLSPIGDLLKRDVYALARLYNDEIELIPKKIIERDPSAELRPNQKDQDTLPPYEKLDESVVRLVEKIQPAKSESDKFLMRALEQSEFKRWQSPPILKVREHSFGRGRRMPIA